MKLQPQILYLLLIIGLATSCQAKPNPNYADELKDCLESSEIEFLNTLSQRFENILLSTYDLSADKAYKQYLKDVATMNIPRGFFEYANFREDIDQFKESKFYQQTWSKTSSFDEEAIIEVPPTVVNSEVQKQEVYDPIVLDPTSDYVKCLSDKNKSKAINDYFEVVEAGIDISPGLVAQALYENLTTEEMNSGLARLIIAINFHYQIGLLMTETEN